jgi:hypothetical protein
MHRRGSHAVRETQSNAGDGDTSEAFYGRRGTASRSVSATVTWTRAKEPNNALMFFTIHAANCHASHDVGIASWVWLCTRFTIPCSEK